METEPQANTNSSNLEANPEAIDITRMQSWSLNKMLDVAEQLSKTTDIDKMIEVRNHLYKVQTERLGGSTQEGSYFQFAQAIAQLTQAIDSARVTSQPPIEES